MCGSEERRAEGSPSSNLGDDLELSVLGQTGPGAVFVNRIEARELVSSLP